MKYFFILLSALCSNSLLSQKMMTIEEIVSIAVKNNYDILLVKNQGEAALVDYRYANAVFLPDLSGTATKLWNDNSQQSDFLDGRKRDGAVKATSINAGVNLNWTLFDGLKMFATKERLEQLKLFGDLNIQAQMVNTVADVSLKYYDIVRQEQQLKAIDTLILINEERVKLADKKLVVGLGSKPELLQARVDLNAQKALRLQQEKLIGQLKEQLNQLAGMPIPTDYQVADSIPINTGIDYNSIAADVEKMNPGLQASRKTIDIASLAVKERKAELLPTLQFNGAYNFNRTKNTTVVNPEFQPLFNKNSGFNYGFSASVPIFTKFNTRRLIRQAGLDLDYNKTAYQAHVSIVNLNLNNVYKDYTYHIKALALEEENIDLAKENIFIALERFRQGASTYLELREAQISLEEAYNRLIAARYNTKVAEIELKRIHGAGYQQPE